MARSSECTEQYAQKVFDSADIVREGIYRQQSARLLREADTAYQVLEARI